MLVDEISLGKGSLLVGIRGGGDAVFSITSSLGGYEENGVRAGSLIEVGDDWLLDPFTGAVEENSGFVLLRPLSCGLSCPDV